MKLALSVFLLSFSLNVFAVNMTGLECAKGNVTLAVMEVEGKNIFFNVTHRRGHKFFEGRIQNHRGLASQGIKRVSLKNGGFVDFFKYKGQIVSRLKVSKTNKTHLLVCRLP